VQVAWMATMAIGQQPHLNEASSTNANLPISLGVPAITIGGGGSIHWPNGSIQRRRTSGPR
jgi:hypothetical protein